MKLTDIFTPDCVKVPLTSTEKSDAIRELVGLLADVGRFSDRAAVADVVLAREATASTGIGRGLAVPHGKTNAVDRLVIAVGKPAEPMEFQSTDGKPVEIIVLLVSPADQTGPHIQALAQISRMMLEGAFSSALAGAKTSRELYDLIASSQP